MIGLLRPGVKLTDDIGKRLAPVSELRRGLALKYRRHIKLYPESFGKRAVFDIFFEHTFSPPVFCENDQQNEHAGTKPYHPFYGRVVIHRKKQRKKRTEASYDQQQVCIFFLIFFIRELICFDIMTSQRLMIIIEFIYLCPKLWSAHRQVCIFRIIDRGFFYDLFEK